MLHLNLVGVLSILILSVKNRGVGFCLGRVYSAGKNFTGEINLNVILPVKLKFYR